MQSFFGFVEFGEQDLLMRREIGQKTDHRRLCIGGVVRDGSRFPLHGLNEIIGRGDELRLGGLNELITSRRRDVIGSAGESKEFAVLIRGHASSDETAASIPRLHYHYCVRQTCYDSVALHKIRGNGFGTGRKLREDASSFERSDSFGTMPERIDAIQTVRRNDDRRDTVL